MKSSLVVLLTCLTCISCDRAHVELKFDGMKGDVKDVTIKYYESKNADGKIKKFNPYGIEKMGYDRSGHNLFSEYEFNKGISGGRTYSYKDGLLDSSTTYQYGDDKNYRSFKSKETVIKQSKTELCLQTVSFSSMYKDWVEEYEWGSDIDYEDEGILKIQYKGNYRYYLIDDNRQPYLTEQFDEDGFIIQRKWFGFDGKQEKQEDFIYNENGFLDKETVTIYDENETKASTTSYEYLDIDKNGNWKERNFYKDGVLEHLEVREIHYYVE